MRTILNIDTSHNESIQIKIIKNGEEHRLEQKLDTKKAQIILPLIDKILSAQNLTLNDISEIKINSGPGSYTGLRVGFTVAYMLAYLLKIPINGKSIGEYPEPVYS